MTKQGPSRIPAPGPRGDRATSDEIAHALKNQLSIILGFSELLAQELDASDPHHNDVMEIRNAAREARAIVDRTLAASGGEEGDRR